MVSEITKTKNLQKRKEVAVIGGGLGGCLSALMLAKKGYHVTLIEGQPVLLNGASAIAARLHLGGEYPLSDVTPLDCLTSAILWKWLMPDSIYTAVPPIQYLISNETQKNGELYPSGLTIKKFKDAYDKIGKFYQAIFPELRRIIIKEEGKEPRRITDQEIQAKLFGSGEPNDFCQPLSPADYKDYNLDGQIAGGFQTQEPGLNIPKYLAMLIKELEAQQSQGNITIKTNCKVNNNGITGKLGQYAIHCLQDGAEEIVNADQIVQAAWQHGPEISALGSETKNGKTKENMLGVCKRGMLLVDLPENFSTGPAFILLGKSGGMLCPLNDKIALVYLPDEAAAYIKNTYLSDSKPLLPRSWDEPELEAESARKAQKYFELAKKRFPVLKDASNPQLMVRDTLIYNENLNVRPQQPVKEVSDKPGVFVISPTKATYALYDVLQVVQSIEARYHQQEHLPFSANEPLNMVVENPDFWSLAYMQEPTQQDYERFFAGHPDLPASMLAEAWPDKPKASTWVERSKQQSPETGRY